MELKEQCIKLAIVDDHILFRCSLARLLAGFEDCRVIAEADNGREFINGLNAANLPDIVLLDLSMPAMDGFATAAWLYQNHPAIHILMLSMYDGDQSIVRLLQYGVKGFLKKDIHPDELHFAIRSVVQSGCYFSQEVSGKLAGLFRGNHTFGMVTERTMLTTQELAFLKLAASDLTYKEIAQRMCINLRAVDGLREHLFEKLAVKSRVGLAMYALRQAIVAF